MSDQTAMKRAAAERALTFVRSGMALGLGSGSTAEAMLHALAAQLSDGRLERIVGVPTSERTAQLATQLGIPLTTLDVRPQLDLALDGADDVDARCDAIKGLGGALLREKVVAASADRLVLMVDERKLVPQLGARSPVPVETIAFALPLVRRRLESYGALVTLRLAADGAPYRTDEGNAILDASFGPIGDVAALAAAIAAIPGVAGHGLFIGMAQAAVVAGASGVRVLERAHL